MIPFCSEPFNAITVVNNANVMSYLSLNIFFFQRELNDNIKKWLLNSEDSTGAKVQDISGMDTFSISGDTNIVVWDGSYK